MAQPKSEKRKLAFELWDKSGRTRTKKSIAEQLNTTEGTVFGWARTDRWKEQPPLSDKPKRKGGAPRGNTNALKHGAYSRFKTLTNEELKLFADIHRHGERRNPRPNPAYYDQQHRPRTHGLGKSPPIGGITPAA
ncbi:hypothetical protein FACS1894208_12140 [Clostridia bacterium]|nr:hypothetical protein FACS1894208_12140 [Clostridia bacterium]